MNALIIAALSVLLRLNNIIVMKRKELVKRCENWWCADNILCHNGQIALIKMDFPQVFILIRDYAETMFTDIDEFKKGIAEVNFFNPADREEADIDEILTDAWNFLALAEEEEERMYYRYKDEDYY